MKEEPVPFEKFAKIGIFPKDLEKMPKELRDPILSGHISPLMRVNVPIGDNSSVSVPMKIQLVRDKNNNLQLIAYQVHKEIDNKLRLTDSELERVRRATTVRCGTCSWTRRPTP